MTPVQAELKKALDFNGLTFTHSETGWSWEHSPSTYGKGLPSLEDAIEDAAKYFDLHLVVNSHLIEVGECRFYMVGVRSECLKFIRKSPATRTLMYPNGRLASYVL